MFSNSTQNQFALLKQSRFIWFFITQFLGAFNDNLFKMALIVLIAYQLAVRNPGLADILANMCTAAFILPFFLFSALAGQLADKYDKATLIRYLKSIEIIIALFAALAFYQMALKWLVGLLMLMGMQSALFGPVKYSYLPRQLATEELIGGNGLIEMGTFLAILTGTIIGGILVGLKPNGILYVSLATVLLAVIGRLCAQRIPATPSTSPDIPLNLNFLSEIYYNFKLAYQYKSIFLMLLAISWFWFLGATFLTQVGNYTARFIYGHESIVTLLITSFSIGIGLGALACEKLSKKQIEKGLIPLGAIGMAIFTLDFSLVHLTFPDNTTPMTLSYFFTVGAYWHCLLALLGLGFFCGIYIVPLYALVQHLSPAHVCSRIIAANNMLNALYMVLSAILAIVLFTIGLTIPQLFIIVAGLHVSMMLSLLWFDRSFWTAFMRWVRPSTN